MLLLCWQLIKGLSRRIRLTDTDTWNGRPHQNLADTDPYMDLNPDSETWNSGLIIIFHSFST